MHNIKVLDCTLRDGGYINKWEFGKKNIYHILSNLVLAKLDYIECGFLKPNEYDNNKSLFKTIEDLEQILPVQNNHTQYTLMINFGEYDINNLPICKNTNIALRIVFKKEECTEALKYCEACKEKGYDVFVNPMHTNSYTAYELLEVVKKVNQIMPKGFTIVDTTGAMKENDLLTVFYIVDSVLDPDIALCFHSHNNLQLSFSNAQCLMKVCNNRELIIDSTVFGMGRGAGNLCTELLTQYINDNYDGQYDLIPILKIVDEYINPIFAQTPWGYSIPYYLAATNHCHPNYAKYLVNKQTVPVEIINDILKILPESKKATYDENLIKQMYLDKFNSDIDDSETLKYIQNLIQDRPILLLAPGKTITSEKNKIDTFIKEKNPFIFSLNFIPPNYNVNLAVITNMKRFLSLSKPDIPMIISSNVSSCDDFISGKSGQYKIINYSSYINSSKLFDSVALMFLKLLIKIGVKTVYFAGMDGFSNIPAENYFSGSLINTTNFSEIDDLNEIMRQMLTQFSKNLEINFVTKSLYERELCNI